MIYVFILTFIIHQLLNHFCKFTTLGQSSFFRQLQLWSNIFPTLVHELGHGLGAVFTGEKIVSIEMNYSLRSADRTGYWGVL